MYFCTLCLSVGPKERSRQALDRLPLVSNILTNFWMQHFHGARLSPNSVRNAVWHALNEPVCQYLRTRNTRCSTVDIDNSLGPLARDSPCISFERLEQFKYLGTTLTHQNSIREEIKSRLKSGNVCYKRYRIFRLPACCPKIQSLRHKEI